MTATVPTSPMSGPATAPASDHTPFRGVLMVVAVTIALLAGCTLAGRIGADESAKAGLGPMESVDQSAFAGETGVWIEHVSLIGGGGLIEIRFRILDSDKSEIVHDVVSPPRLIASDGFEVRYQRHEHGHDRVNRLGATYNEQLINIGNQVQRGEIVTVLIGEAELKGVPVQ